jgi:hypothetical protein
MNAALGHAMLKLKTVFAGDSQIEYETARLARSAMREELLRVFKGSNVIAGGTKKSFGSDADEWLVIDHQYDGCFGIHDFCLTSPLIPADVLNGRWPSLVCKMMMSKKTE